MRRASVLVTGVLAVVITCAGARAEQALVLLEAGVYAEEVVGDLDRAIDTYRKIIADAEANRPCVAEAHYRLGKCYLARGNKEQAREQFALIAERYPDQAKLAEAAQRELAKLQPPALPPAEARRVVLPDMDQDARGLDLDTGQLVPFPVMEEGGPRELMAVLAGRGIDIVYDRVAVLVEGTTAQKEQVELEGGYAVHILSDVPTNIVTTREGGRFELSIVASGRGGCHIEFRRLAPAPGEGANRIILPPMDTHHVALDLAAGQLVPMPMFPTPGGPEEWPAAVQEYVAAMKELARGDVGFGYYEKRPVVFLLRDAVADRPLPQFPDLPFSYFDVSRLRFPAGLEVTTSEGATYEVIFTGVDDRGSELEYTLVSQPEKTQTHRLYLPEVDASLMYLDLSTGRLLTLPDDMDKEELMRRFLEQGGHFVVYDDRWLVVPVGTVADYGPKPVAGGTFLAWEVAEELGRTLAITTVGGVRYRITLLADAGGGCELEYRRIGAREPVGTGPSPDVAARLTDLRIRLADARAELTTKQAEIEAAEKAVRRIEKSVDLGRADGADLARARADFTRAQVELEVARQKAEILTAEIARLQAGPQAAPAPVLSKPYLAVGTEMELALGTGTALDLETASLVDVPADVAGSARQHEWLTQAEADLAWCPPADLLAAQMRTRDRLLRQGAPAAGRPPADSVRQTLNERVPAQFVDTPIQDVAEFFNQVTEAQIVLLPGVPALDPPVVTVTIEAPFAEVLDHVVRSADLAWKADGDLIWLGTPEEVSAFALVRGIDVQPADHVTEALNERAPVQFRDTPLGRVVDFLQQTTPVDVLVLPDARQSTATVSLSAEASRAEVLDAICRRTRMAWRVDRSAINIGTPRELGLLEDGVLESVTGIDLAAMPMPPGSDYGDVRRQLDSVDNRPGVALVEGRLPLKYLVRTEGGAVCVLELFAAELTTAGPRVHVRYRYIERPGPMPSDVGEGGRLTDLRLRLVDARTELSKEEAQWAAARSMLEEIQKLEQAGQAAEGAPERIQASFSRAEVELEAARQKVEILTREIERLQARPQAAPAPSDPDRLSDLQMRLADAKAELTASEATVRYWQREIERTEPLAKAGRGDPAAVERARLELSRAQAGTVAARQKVEILTQEIARLEAAAPGPGGPLREAHVRRKVEREQEKQAILEAMHAVGVAMLMYKADHDGAYPPDPGGLEKGRYLQKEESPFGRWPDLGWRYVVPDGRNPGAVVLYHWPPVDGQVTVLHEDQAVQSVKVGTDGVLRNPRTGETIATEADSP